MTMKALFRLLKIVPYEYINDKLADAVSTEKAIREEVRAAALNRINELGSTPATADIKSIMSELNINLDNSYARERMLTDFITKIKE
jgi:hypothetical protein